MTESDELTGATPGRTWSRRRHPVPVVVLAVLALVLAVACVVVAIWPTAVPGRSAAEKADDRNVAVTSAARTITRAFLDVDYRDMDTRIDKVLGLATGAFKNQYETAKVDLKSSVEQAKAVTTSSVRDVGLADVDDDTAVVYVAADTKVSNLAIQKDKAAGKDVQDERYYRFQLSLTKVGDRWLLNDLQFIS